MKKIFFSALMLGAALFASAQSKYDHYYTNLPIEIERVQEVKFPSTSVNIAQYGAVPDGKTDCTEAFDKAIKELSKQGGGHVIVPRGHLSSARTLVVRVTVRARGYTPYQPIPSSLQPTSISIRCSAGSAV